MSNIGEICVKRFSESSYNKFDITILKSGIQKYCRRQELDKGLWCLIEMDLFSLVEDENKFDKQTYIGAKKLRSNMINRLIVIMSEEVSIANWWLPIKIHELYVKWQNERYSMDDNYGRKTLYKMYKYLIDSNKIRIISDYRSVFILPTYYKKEKDMKLLISKHNELVKNYKGMYEKLYGENYCNVDIEILKKLIIEHLDNCNDNIFIIMRDIFLHKSEKELKIKVNIIWDILKTYCKTNIKNDKITSVINSLEFFYKKMTHQEKYIYLYHAILLIINRNIVDFSNEIYDLQIDNDTINKLYNEHINNKIIEIDEYIKDIHTKNKKNIKDGLTKFAIEGAYVKNEDKKFLNDEYRDIYINLKKLMEGM